MSLRTTWVWKSILLIFIRGTSLKGIIVGISNAFIALILCLQTINCWPSRQSTFRGQKWFSFPLSFIPWIAMQILPPWFPALACPYWLELCCLRDLPGAWRQPWTNRTMSKCLKPGSKSTDVLSAWLLLWQHLLVLKGFIGSLTWLVSLYGKYYVCSYRKF